MSLLQLISEFIPGRKKIKYAVPVMQVNPQGEALTNHSTGHAATVVPSDTTVFTEPSHIRNWGDSGLFYADMWFEGTKLPVYLNQGDMTPFPVKKVYSDLLGAGVALTRHW